MVHTYDIAGYAYEGACYCEKHALDRDIVETASPIFEGEETDRDIVCDDCFSECVRDKHPGEWAIILHKNLWYDSELREIAEETLQKQLKETAIPSSRAMALGRCIDFLGESNTVAEFYEKIEDFIASLSYDSIQYSDTEYSLYEDILDSVKDAIRQKRGY